MKIQTSTRHNTGAALAAWLAISAITLAVGIGLIIVAKQREPAQIEMFGAKIATSSVFLAGLFITVVGGVAAIRSWRKSKSEGVTIQNSQNVNVGSQGAQAGNTYYSPPPSQTYQPPPPPPRYRQMGGPDV